jgi:hypothetical protein
MPGRRFLGYKRDSLHPQRTPFIAAKDPSLAERVRRLLKNTL